MRLEITFFLLLSILFTSCAAERPYPWLEDLDANEGYLDSGKDLMAVEFGLNSLEIKKNTESRLLIAVLGSNSPG